MTHNQVAYMTGMRQAEAARKQAEAAEKNAETNVKQYNLAVDESKYNREQNVYAQIATVVSTAVAIGGVIAMCFA